MRQPVWVRSPHSGRFWNVPPTGAPVGHVHARAPDELGREEHAATVGHLVDLVLHHPAQEVRALAVPDECERAALVVLVEVVEERVADGVVGDLLGLGARQRTGWRDRLRVPGREHAARRAEACRLVPRDGGFGSRSAASAALGPAPSTRTVG